MTARKTRKKHARSSSLDQFHLDPTNARRHPERNLTMITDAIREVGAARSIVVDERLQVLAGEGALKGAKAAGVMKVKIVDADGRTLVAVRRRGLSPAQKTRLALYDNRTAELAEWDPIVLSELTAAGVDLSGLWTEDELRELLAAEDGLVEGRTDPDAVPALRPTSVVAGDLFALGRHRLLCGDSTDPATVARLMAGARAPLFATDPPYLVDYTGANHPQSWKDRASKNKDWSATYRDWDAKEQGADFYRAFIRVALDEAIAPRAAWYCWHAALRQRLVESVWEEMGAFVHQQIIWVKTRAVLTRSVYLWQHEPCLFGWVRPRKPWVARGPIDGAHPTTVWEIPSREVETTEHPTSKPVRCFTVPMLLHTRPGDVCYEPFSGSGSQIMAAEQTGRACYALEREPAFVQLAIDRWEAFTGTKAAKVAGEVARGRRRTEAPDG